MLDLAISNLIGVAADAVANTVDDAVASHDVMRTKREAYRAKIEDAAKVVMTGAFGQMVDQTRARYEDRLSHPRLLHGAIVDDGRAAGNSLQQAIVADQTAPTWSTKLTLVLASIRVIAITQVVGPECIYLEPQRRAGKVARAKASDGRKSRRAICLADIPASLLEIVAALSPADPRRAGAISRLKAAVGTAEDADGIAAKLYALSTARGHDKFFAELAMSAAKAAGVDPSETGVVRLSMPAAPADGGVTLAFVACGADASDVERVAAKPILGTRPEIAVSTSDRRPVADKHTGIPPIDDDGGDLAEIIYRFAESSKWVIEDHGKTMRLKKLDKRLDVNAAFDKVGHLTAVQDRLREIRSGATR